MQLQAIQIQAHHGCKRHAEDGILQAEAFNPNTILQVKKKTVVSLCTTNYGGKRFTPEKQYDAAKQELRETIITKSIGV